MTLHGSPGTSDRKVNARLGSLVRRLLGAGSCGPPGAIPEAVHRQRIIEAIRESARGLGVGALEGLDHFLKGFMCGPARLLSICIQEVFEDARLDRRRQQAQHPPALVLG